MKAIINSVTSLASCQRQLHDDWLKHHFLRVNWQTGADRSLDQNALSHVWYGQISRELDEDTPEGVKCECKFRFGVPILMAEDEEWRGLFANLIRNLNYEDAVKAMRLIPVTRLFTKNQFSRYLEAIQKDYAPRVQLEFPEEPWKS